MSEIAIFEVVQLNLTPYTARTAPFCIPLIVAYLPFCPSFTLDIKEVIIICIRLLWELLGLYRLFFKARIAPTVFRMFVPFGGVVDNHTNIVYMTYPQVLFWSCCIIYLPLVYYLYINSNRNNMETKHKIYIAIGVLIFIPLTLYVAQHDFCQLYYGVQCLP